jgi:hypothetical protein
LWLVEAALTEMILVAVAAVLVDIERHLDFQ